jgi:hypothetical protein
MCRKQSLSVSRRDVLIQLNVLQSITRSLRHAASMAVVVPGIKQIRTAVARLRRDRHPLIVYGARADWQIAAWR